MLPRWCRERASGRSPETLSSSRSAQNRYGEAGRICSDPSVQVKRVSDSFGATPLGRRPRRTKSVGTSAPSATAIRVRPMPSVRQRSERPTTSRRASRDASRTPAPPGRTRTGSVAIPTTCCTRSEARARSRLASRRPRAGSASVPRSRSVVPATAQARPPPRSRSSRARRLRTASRSVRWSSLRSLRAHRHRRVRARGRSRDPGREDRSRGGPMLRREARGRHRARWRGARRPLLARPSCRRRRAT